MCFVSTCIEINLHNKPVCLSILPMLKQRLKRKCNRGPHSSDLVEPKFEPRQLDAKDCALNYYYYFIT